MNKGVRRPLCGVGVSRANLGPKAQIVSKALEGNYEDNGDEKSVRYFRGAVKNLSSQRLLLSRQFGRLYYNRIIITSSSRRFDPSSFVGVSYTTAKCFKLIIAHHTLGRSSDQGRIRHSSPVEREYYPFNGISGSASPRCIGGH